MASRLNLKYVFVALLVLATLPSLSFAALNQADPTGKNGSAGGEWDPKWSEAFFKCWDKYAAQGSSGENAGKIEEAFKKGLKDVGPNKEWCPVSGALEEPYQVKLFQLATLKELCKPESSCKPEAVNPHGATARAIGLFQIGANDAQSHKCKGPEGQSISSEDDLKKAENNICCQIQIESNIAGGKTQKAEDQNTFASGKNGLMGAFWQPMRQGTGGDGAGGSVNDTANSDKIKKGVNEACQQLASGGYSGGNKLTSEEFQTAQNGSNTATATLNIFGRR